MKNEYCLNYCLFIAIFGVFFFSVLSIGAFINMETLILKKEKHIDAGYGCLVCIIVC